MANIRQTVPAYAAGISEQPDHLKFPGQVKDCINAVPDVTQGLFKRPGARRVGTTKLPNVQSGGSWFHYFRDESEGSYIGQVAADGQLRMWKASGNNAGAAQTIVYGTGGQTAIQNYLQTATPENIQTLTINDTTFLSNRDSSDYTQAEIDGGGTPALDTDGSTLQAGDARTVTIVSTTGTTDARPEAHCAFIELTRTENGRQYAVNIYDDSSTGNLTTVNRATRVKITGNTFDETDGTGHCPGIGTAVFAVNAATDYTGTSTANVRGTNTLPAIVGTSNVNGFFGSNFIQHSNVHGLYDGDTVLYTTNVAQGGITTNTVYHVTRKDATSFYLSATAADQAAGTYITLTAQAPLGSYGTQTFTPQEKAQIVTGRDNLIVRLTALGQQAISPNYNAAANGPGGDNYRASYSLEIVLLHGGEGWVTGDSFTVKPEFADEAANVTTTGSGSSKTTTGSQATMTVTVLDHETTEVKATVATANDGLIRPSPTPFDADTAVTAEAILGGIATGLPSGITAKVIGTGVYYSSANPFTVEVLEDDIMRVFQKSVNDVSRLPAQCRHGYIVKVANARISEEDDYYLRFEGENNLDGSGTWVECAKPGIEKSLTNMPLAIQRTALANQGTSTEIATFTIKQFTYADRGVGDNLTNPLPSFVGKRINKVVFFRNRLALLAGENVVLCRPGSLGTPDFFAESALATGAADAIDIACASTFPSDIFDAIEVNSGLLVFSTNQQFLLSSDAEILNPETAKLRSVATYNYNKDISPISLGVTVAYVDNSGKFSRFNEMANVRREGEPVVVEPSKIVPTLLAKDIDLLTNSRENSMVLFGKTNSDTVSGFRYFNVGDKRQQQAWFKWKFNNPLLYHFIINDDYYFLDTDNFLQTLSLVQDDDDISIDQDGVNYLLHLDNYTTVTGGSYSASTNLTTFTGQSTWIPDVTTPNGTLVVIDKDAASARIGRYGIATLTGNNPNDDFTLPGDWSTGTFNIGYLYDYQVDFPTIYPTQVQGEKSNSDVNGTLVLHRLRVHFGKIGLYETTLNRVGKPAYTEVYESTELDEYEASDAPFVEEVIRTVPVYEKNINVDITVKSTHPSPATLRAMSWEGSFTPKFYKRV